MTTLKLKFKSHVEFGFFWRDLDFSWVLQRWNWFYEEWWFGNEKRSRWILLWWWWWWWMWFNSCEIYLCFNWNVFLCLLECFVRLGIGFPTKCKMNQEIWFVKHKMNRKIMFENLERNLKMLFVWHKFPNLVKLVQSISLHRLRPATTSSVTLQIQLRNPLL